jgi:hypothetical protein
VYQHHKPPQAIGALGHPESAWEPGGKPQVALSVLVIFCTLAGINMAACHGPKVRIGLLW